MKKFESGKHFIAAEVFDKNLKIELYLAFVYDPAHEEGREEFLLEFSRICNSKNIAMLIGGDFNIIRFSGDKNKSFNGNKWSDLFNHIINTQELTELYLNDGKYTWSNNQENPTLEKLDRVLINDEWEKFFPLSIIHKTVRFMSDHNPIIISTGSKHTGKRKPFRFETSWLKQEGLKEKIKEIWDPYIISRSNIDK